MAVVFWAAENLYVGTSHRAGVHWILGLAFLGTTGAAHAACNAPSKLTALAQTHPTTENLINLGSWYASHQQFACAVATFKGAVKRDPQSAQLRYLEGLALVGAGNTAEAVPELEESARIEPQVLKPHLMLGQLLEEAGDHAAAEKQWRLALKIDSHSEAALEGLSNDLLAQKEFAAVIALLRDAPRTEKLAINLSRALGIYDYLDDAANVLNEAMQRSPQSLDLARAMTVVLVKQHKYQEAIKLVQNTADQHPNDLSAQIDLFRILVLTNHFDRARPLEPKLLAVRPRDPEILYLSGIVDRAVGNNDLAKTHLEAAVALQPDFFNSRYNLGMVLVLLHQWQAAKENLEKAIALDTPVPEVHFELAKALKGLGENDRAAQELKTYQQLKKADATALESASAAAQGDKAIADKKPQEAITHYREACEGAPANAVYKYKLAIAFAQSGDSANQKAQLEEAIKLDPHLAGAQNELGYVLSRAGDIEGAIQHFRLAVESAPAWTEAWINLSAELAMAAHYPEAREAAAQALALDPGNAQARELSDQLAKDPAAQQAQKR